MKEYKGKVKMSLLTPEVMKQVAMVLTFGAEKYDPDNWKTEGHTQEIFMDAALRHIYDHLEGEVYDKESGLKHLAHAICNLMFTMWHIDNKPLIRNKQENDDGSK